MKKTTDELLKILKHSPKIQTYLDEEKENISSVPLSDYLNRLCKDKQMSPAECIRKSSLDRTYAYQIFSGTKAPARNKVLALGFGFSLSFEEMQSLLKSTGYPALYPRDERDSAIIFAMQRECSLVQTNELLLAMGFEVIQ